jgi:hypothetical protein
MDQGQIDLFHLPRGKGRGQTQPGRFVQGHGQEAGGVLVQAMHDSGPDRIHPSGLLPGEIRKMVQQPMDQGALIQARSGVDYKIGGLVQDCHVVVLVENVQVMVFRRQSGIRDGCPQFQPVPGR